MRMALQGCHINVRSCGLDNFCPAKRAVEVCSVRVSELTEAANNEKFAWWHFTDEEQTAETESRDGDAKKFG
jgi:hypothetical protein